MPVSRLGLTILSAWGFASSAWAACLPDGPAAQVFTTQGASERAVKLMVVSGTLLTMDAYRAKNLRGIKTDCEVATLRRGKTVYVVSGTSDTALPRITKPNDRKAPLFFLMTVPDITGAMIGGDKPPGALGYALASQGDKYALLFRAYDVIPPDLQLASDVAAALEGRISPMLSADLASHQIQISVAKGAGEVGETQPGRAATP